MNTQAELPVRKLVENLILADRAMQRHGGIIWGERYEELRKPIRKARADLDEALEKAVAIDKSQRAEIERKTAALQGFFRNSTRADWPDDIYDAAENALTPQPPKE